VSYHSPTILGRNITQPDEEAKFMGGVQMLKAALPFHDNVVSVPYPLPIRCGRRPSIFQVSRPFANVSSTIITAYADGCRLEFTDLGIYSSVSFQN
jgi:hypothetical protein